MLLNVLLKACRNGYFLLCKRITRFSFHWLFDLDINPWSPGLLFMAQKMAITFLIAIFKGLRPSEKKFPKFCLFSLKKEDVTKISDDISNQRIYN